MTSFTDDGKNVVQIGLHEHSVDSVFQDRIDFSADFYDVGSLPYHEELGAYVVDDVNYLIEQAEDWLNQRGDFKDDIVPEGKERTLDILTLD